MSLFIFQEEKAKVVANCDHLRNLKYSPNMPYVGQVLLQIIIARE